MLEEIFRRLESRSQTFFGFQVTSSESRTGPHPQTTGLSYYVTTAKIVPPDEAPIGD